MNKTVSFIILGLMVISVIGMASAVAAGTTFIGGKIYDADYSDTIGGASVTVTCNINVLTATSSSDGSYGVTYPISNCNVGDTLTVEGSKGSLYGIKTGEIHEINSEFDFAIVNVPLVPEFGLFIGGLTILSAVGIFFFVRKR